MDYVQNNASLVRGRSNRPAAAICAVNQGAISLNASAAVALL